MIANPITIRPSQIKGSYHMVTPSVAEILATTDCYHAEQPFCDSRTLTVITEDAISRGVYPQLIERFYTVLQPCNCGGVPVLHRRRQ